MSKHKRKALGKGLDALIPMNESSGEHVALVDVGSVDPNPYQPRSYIDDTDLISLIDSIKEKGVIEPIIVRDKPGNRFEVICGERRLEASKRAGLERIPAVVKELSDREALELAIVENVQRESLNPIDEARGYKRLMDEFGETQDEIARSIGKSRASITNAIRLLRLPAVIREMLAKGELKEGHARIILRLDSDKDRLLIARKVKSQGITVRQLEKMIEPKYKKKKIKGKESPFMKDIEVKLSRHLGTKVKILAKGGKGSIKIEFYSDEELSRIIELIKYGYKEV